MTALPYERDAEMVIKHFLKEVADMQMTRRLSDHAFSMLVNIERTLLFKLYANLLMQHRPRSRSECEPDHVAGHVAQHHAGP